MRKALVSMSGGSRGQSTFKGKSLTVLLLNKTRITIPIKNKTRFGDILINLRKHLSLSSSNIFGLAYKTEHGDFMFVDPLCKVLKRERTINQRSEAKENSSQIYLRVQYYVESGHHFRSASDKKYYYLQLKENFLKFGFNYPDDRCFLLASYAIHSDEVNWREFDPREYFPAWILKSYGTQFVRRHMPTIIPERMTPCQAMSTYIKELSSPSPYIYNMRLYRVQSSKSRNTNNMRIGISQDGLEIYEVDCRGYLNFLNSCLWTQIQAIHGMKRKIIISVNFKNLEFYTCSEEWCRELCSMIRSAQRVCLGLDSGAALQSDQFLELDDTSFREAYIHSDEHDLEWEYEQSALDTLTSNSQRCAVADPVHHSSASSSSPVSYSHCGMSTPNRSRFSIISSTSSTTTSGIVSDRTCHSTEVSQEDLISSTTRPSSCDSMLDSEDEYYPTSVSSRLATVQRAISEPSKKFEQLRFKVQQSPKSLPRRALSDETIDEHDYENIAIIRKTLGISNPVVRSKANSYDEKISQKQMSTSRSADHLSANPYSFQSPKLSLDTYGLKVPYHYSSVSSPTQSHNRYSFISNSPSMEKLLLDYTPPPSYNEAHARQRHLMLSTSRQASEDSTTSSSLSGIIPYSPVRTSTPVSVRPAQHRPSFSKQMSETHEVKSSPVEKKLRKQVTTTKEQCNCLKLSNPEIDKLRTEVKNAMISLPMLSALCNDNELIKSTNQCNCDTNTKSPRPVSWHCESEPVFTFPPTQNVNEQQLAQACR